MLAGSDPIEARAARMTSVDRNQQIRYENNAVVWQGPNRITADIIDIDRKNQVLTATGNVVSQFVDKHDADDKKKKPATSVFTTIRAPKLTYTDKERVALYSGGAVLNRPGVVVNGKEIRIWLTPAAPGKDSTLDRAFADGQVKIVQTAPDRTRTGTGEHGEYYLADERMVLNGGSPQLVDTIKGTTRGQQLTWFARNDRLLVESAESQPAITSLRKK
jgi:lipopolysaccharide export system protein LptA